MRITFCLDVISLPPLQVHAWEIADQLLRLKRDVPTSTFAAHTMRGKVRRGGPFHWVGEGPIQGRQQCSLLLYSCRSHYGLVP